MNEDDILGEGRYGMVIKGQWSNNPVAVKRIQLHDIECNKEEETLQKLNHPNVVKLFHVKSDENFRYFYLELCTASLDKLFLKDEDSAKYCGPIPQKIEVLYQLAIGLEYIHQMGFAHCDIHPQNVLIWVDSKTEKVLMKWSGFGLSKRVNETGTYSMSGVKRRIDWLAPEMLRLLDDEEANLTEIEAQQRGAVKSDVFVEGLIFGYYLLEGIHLFGKRSEIGFNICNNKPVNLQKIVAEEPYELIVQMLENNPDERISSSFVAKRLEMYMAKKKVGQLHSLHAMDTRPRLNKIKVNEDTILGEGGCSRVFEGTWNGERVAIKRIDLSKVEINSGEEALKQLDHPNVIKIFDIESDNIFRYYVLELCVASLDKLFLRDGDPQKYLGPMPPDSKVLYQLANGLEYIHKMGLIHRDIKPENVLIWMNPANGEAILKWCDLKSSNKVQGTIFLTPGWSAPEILKSLDNEDMDPSEREECLGGTVESDVFAEGLVFGYYLLGGMHPFGSLYEKEWNIVTNKPINLNKVQPEYFRKLIDVMLQPSPGDRISSADVTRKIKEENDKIRNI